MDITVQSGGIVDCWGKKDGYRMIREAGFDGIDWNLDMEWDPEKLRRKEPCHCIFEEELDRIEAYFEDELAEIRKNDLKIIQAHAPFPPYFRNYPEFNDYAVRVLQQCTRFCGAAGVKYLIVHGISLAVDDDTQTPETVREMNLRLYESLIPILKETDVVVCLENLFTWYQGHAVEGVCSDPREAVWYIDYLNEKAGKECFALCLDTGHLNLLGRKQDTYIRALGSRIRALHIHDNIGQQDEHLAPYTGNIRWDDFTAGLREIGYSGSLNFETFRQVVLYRVDRETVPLWLNLIHGIGEVFRKKITEE